MQTILCFLSVLFSCMPLIAASASARELSETQDNYYFLLNRKTGLSSDSILQFTQLQDGPMAILTTRGVDFHNGQDNRFVSLQHVAVQQLDGYKGHAHLYVDNGGRLWIKLRNIVYCINLKNYKVVDTPFVNMPAAANSCPDDLFADSYHRLWLVKGDKVINEQATDTFRMNHKWGSLQDIDADEEHVYTFHSTGRIAIFNKRSHILENSYLPYDTIAAQNYSSTSLVVKTSHGQFYQIRTGQGGSVFLHFNPQTLSYSKIYTCNYILHTLNMPSDYQALISSEQGYLMFDFHTGNQPKSVSTLSLPDGTSLTTGINTVFRDNDGGIWLGTYKNGVIYISPLLGLFFTEEKTTNVIWIIAGIAAMVTLLLGIMLYVYHNRKKEERYENTPLPEPLHNDTAQSSLATKARQLVETHLSDSDYGVEQLAADLCMERTGLYKKLTAATGDTPVIFIRNIRLDHAASMILQKEHSINEVAELTGFASASYFTKCFKDRFGTKPSEYA